MLTSLSGILISDLLMSFLYLLLSSLFCINLHAVCELTCSNDFRDEQGVMRLMVGARGPFICVPSNGKRNICDCWPCLY